MIRQLAALMLLALALAGCGAVPPRVPPPLPTQAAPSVEPTAPPIAAPSTEPTALSLNLPTDRATTLAAIALGTPFEVALGAELALGESGLSLRFAEVAEDSRCPANAQCIWQGRAVIALEVTAPGAETQRFSLAIPGDITPDAPELQSLGPYSLRLLALDPYPDATNDVAGPYLATLVLERSAP